MLRMPRGDSLARPASRPSPHTAGLGRYSCMDCMEMQQVLQAGRPQFEPRHRLAQRGSAWSSSHSTHSRLGAESPCLSGFFRLSILREWFVDRMWRYTCTYFPYSRDQSAHTNLTLRVVNASAHEPASCNRPVHILPRSLRAFWCSKRVRYRTREVSHAWDELTSGPGLGLHRCSRFTRSVNLHAANFPSKLAVVEKGKSSPNLFQFLCLFVFSGLAPQAL
jgi:hypothetical protein